MTMLLLTMLTACETDADCPEAACPTCPEVPQAALEDWEAELLGPQLQDLRAGVRAWPGEGSLGICQGASECDTFVGLDGGTLGPGDHMIRAELAVPQVGDGWQVRFEVACAVTLANGKTNDVDHDKTYDVTYTGPTRGYRLQPLWRIQSPHPQGQRDCTWSLTPLRPDGTEGDAVVGAYTTPMPT